MNTMLGLCVTFLLTPQLDADAAVRACLLAPHFVDSAERHQHEPVVLAAIAWQETNFKHWLVGSSGERGAMQVLPDYSALTPEELAQPQPGIEAGAYALRRWYRTAPNLADAVYRYNCGYVKRPRCARYQEKVLWRIRVLSSAWRA